jgi:hypothetical protein
MSCLPVPYCVAIGFVEDRYIRKRGPLSMVRHKALLNEFGDLPRRIA